MLGIARTRTPARECAKAFSEEALFPRRILSTIEFNISSLFNPQTFFFIFTDIVKYFGKVREKKNSHSLFRPKIAVKPI